MTGSGGGGGGGGGISATSFSPKCRNMSIITDVLMLGVGCLQM